MTGAAEGFALAVSAFSAFMALRLILAWWRLKHHPHVEPLDVAAPDLAPFLNALVRDLSDRLGIEPPPVYVRRAAMPNAFVVAAILRHELFLTDELLEECDERQDGLEYLKRTIAHELMHIRRNDALRLGWLTWLMHTAAALGLASLERAMSRRIAAIDEETDRDVVNLLDLHGPQKRATESSAESA